MLAQAGGFVLTHSGRRVCVCVNSLMQEGLCLC